MSVDKDVNVIRLARHSLRLPDGSAATITVGGQGIPLIVVPGFSFDCRLYVQTLSRLASLGFKVVAIDVAGHGGSPALARNGQALAGYSRLLGGVIDHLGIHRAILLGHSLGGRLVVDVAARRPGRVIALLLVDASVGEPWDRLAALYRRVPAALGFFGAVFLADALGAVPFARDAEQAVKLARLAVPTVMHNLGGPWGLYRDGVSALNASPSTPLLERLRSARVPCVVIHGDCDPVVPLGAARDAATRAAAELVVVHGASHSWLLRDPETLPGIVAELLEARLGRVLREAVAGAGRDPASTSMPGIDRMFSGAGGLVHQPGARPDAPAAGLRRRGRQPQYRWSQVASSYPGSRPEAM